MILHFTPAVTLIGMYRGVASWVQDPRAGSWGDL